MPERGIQVYPAKAMKITDKMHQNSRSNTTAMTARDNILSAFDAKTKKLLALAEDALYRATIERLFQEYIDVGVTRFVVKAFPDACDKCTAHLGEVYTPEDKEKLPPYHQKCRCIVVPADENGQPLFLFGSIAVQPTVLLPGANEGQRMFDSREGRPEPPSNEGNGEDYIDYIGRSLNQILLVNYTEDKTALGTLGQIGLGFTGLDFPADMRDVSHDIANWTPTWEHAGKTLLDAIGLIPIVGVLKNADEAAGLVKVAIKQSDELVSEVKHVDDVINSVQDATKHSNELLEAAGNLKPQALMDDLAKSGAKYNPNDVVMVTKTPDGKLLWLENGSNSAGLKHIVNGHGINFADKGITDIPTFLNQTLQNTPINTGMGAGGPFADYLIDGSTYRVAYGTNGFIVSFYPIK